MNTDKHDAIKVDRLTKRFQIVTIPKHTTLKEAIVSFNLFRSTQNRRSVTAVEDVSFTVSRGAALGVVGRNGSGKSTLLRLLAGIYSPTSGFARVAGSVAPLLSLGLGFHPDMTGRENLIINGLVLGLSRREIDRRLEDIVQFSELGDFIDAPVRMYSAGMYMRLAFSVAVSVDPDVLLLDEVLAVGDESFAAKCQARMREFRNNGKTIVLVSHDPKALLDWCDRAIWLDKGRLRMSGPTAHVLNAYHSEIGLESTVSLA